MKTIAKASLVISFLLIFSSSNAQKVDWDKVLKDWNASIHFGTTMPYTDIRNYDWAPTFDPVSEMQYGVGASITKMMGNVFGIQARYTYGRVRGVNDGTSNFYEDELQENIYGFKLPFFFSTSFHQPSISIYTNWSNMFIGTNRIIRAKMKGEDIKSRKVSAYTRIGVGMIFYDAKLYDGANAKFRDSKNVPVVGNKYFLKGYSNKVSEIVIPVAFGLKFKASKAIDVSLEAEYNFIWDDKFDAMVIDGFHRNATPGASDGFDKFTYGSIGGRYDKYLMISAGVHYKFGSTKSQKEHLEWINPLEAYMETTDEKLDYLLDNMYKVKDADGDGVIDELDEEPDTQEGARVDTKGRTLDSDGDGCPDHLDPEPYSTPLLPIENCVNVYPKPGLTEEMVKEINNMIEAKKAIGWALSMIHFDLDKADIKPDMIPELFKVAVMMEKFPDLEVNVIGHTDVRHTDAYNMKLSERRTTAAINYLVERFGVDRSRLTAKFKGEHQNLFKNAKAEPEHYINRRVEFMPANY